MFSVIRENVSIIEVAEKLLPVGLKTCGDNTFAPEDEECCFCGHHDCLRFKDDGPDSLFRCFSCGKTGDVTRFVASFKEVSDVEAAKWIAKEYNLKLPNDYSPVQEAFNLAVEYYHNCLLEAGPLAELRGVTPLEYQEKQRNHTATSLSKFKVGWSDGRLCEYLLSVGIPEEIVKETGLLAKNGKSDFLPSKCFIYPHFIRSRCSHFTFKDPLKKISYQLPNKYKLNGHCWYNSDSLRKPGAVALVEGENDCISVDESEWDGPILCCNGSISKTQLDWLHENLRGREIVTFFDMDPAGDGYREKVGKIHGFKSVRQVRLTSGQKDVDEYLKSGGNLTALVDFAKVETEISKISDAANKEEEDEEDSPHSTILEKGGSYFRIRYKEGQQYLQRLTNFTVELRNIFVRGQEREREVIVRRADGVLSKPLIIPSEAKVSIKPFKILICNAVDGTYYGKEEDLADIWSFVYAKGKETIVILPETIGRLDEYEGWLFGDSFLADNGKVYFINDDGIIWFDELKFGIRPMSLNASSITRNGIASGGVPFLVNDLAQEEVESLLRGFIEQLSVNYGGINGFGNALTCVGYLWSCVYSNVLFTKNNSFPFLMLWGTGSKGKTTILKWLLDFFSMSETGWTTVSNLNTGVGWGRKMAYYASLPVCIDELRVDKATKDMYGTFRGYFDRASRYTGTNKDATSVNDRPIRSCVMFGGQDQFDDDATRQRCIPIRISGKEERELTTSYNWIDSRKHELSSIGNLWVKNYGQFTGHEVIVGTRGLEDELRKLGVNARTARNWAIAGFFANKLSQTYFPKFNYQEYLLRAVNEDLAKQNEDNLLNNFFEVVAGLQVSQRELITGDHIRVEGNRLYIWFADVFRIVQRENPRTDNPFSKRAILEELREEGFFVKEDIKPMGMSETQRRVIILDLTTATEVVQNVGSFCRQ